jgi:hypothetical protein
MPINFPPVQHLGDRFTPSTPKMNRTRAGRAAAVVQAYSPERFATALMDLLCDLHHACDAERVRFDEVLGEAREHYASEIKEARG